MNKVDSIERICKLISNVGERVYEHKLAHDCICSKQSNVNAQIDDEVISFIESAVEEAISKII